MEKTKYFILFKNGWPGLLLACIIGFVSCSIESITKSPLVDELLIALIIGMAIRVVVSNNNKRLVDGFILAPLIFIPIGVIFYGAVNLNFVEFAKININFIILLGIIGLAYFGTILGIGRLLKQRRQITFLTATGSAICGASAIVITAPVVEAEPDDVSISLISVFIAASFGLFIFLPFLAGLLDMTGYNYALLSAMVLQFTGFVKAATEGLSKEVYTLALSVKAARYLGLLIAIPLFATITKKRFYIPWFLWAFLGAGLAFSFIPVIAELLTPLFKPALKILWSIAMAAIGLNANIKVLLSDDGLKALFMSFIGFFVACGAFLIGSLIMGGF